MYFLFSLWTPNQTASGLSTSKTMTFFFKLTKIQGMYEVGHFASVSGTFKIIGRICFSLKEWKYLFQTFFFYIICKGNRAIATTSYQNCADCNREWLKDNRLFLFLILFFCIIFTFWINFIIILLWVEKCNHNYSPR